MKVYADTKKSDLFNRALSLSKLFGEDKENKQKSKILLSCRVYEQAIVNVLLLLLILLCFALAIATIVVGVSHIIANPSLIRLDIKPLQTDEWSEAIKFYAALLVVYFALKWFAKKQVSHYFSWEKEHQIGIFGEKFYLSHILTEAFLIFIVVLYMNNPIMLSVTAPMTIMLAIPFVFALMGWTYLHTVGYPIEVMVYSEDNDEPVIETIPLWRAPFVKNKMCKTYVDGK